MIKNSKNTISSGEKLDLNIDIIDKMDRDVKDYLAKVDESMLWIFQPTVNFLNILHAAAEDPESVVWHNFTTPPEFAYAMGLKPFCIEYLSLIASPFCQNYFLEYVDKAHSAYIPEYICSYSKGTMGMALAANLPKPVALFHTSTPCDSGIMTNQAFAEYYGVKSYCLDVPYYDSEESHEYFKGQVKGCFEYLEQQTGKKLNIDRYHEVMEKSHRAHELLWEINELKKKKPCPIPTGTALRQTVLAMSCGGGTDETVSYLEKHLEDAKNRVERGIGVEGAEEKIRTSWLVTFVSYDWGLYSWLEKKYGVVPVSYLGSHYTYRAQDISSLDKLHRALGDRTLEVHMGRQFRGHFDDYVKDCIHWTRDWDCQAAIFVGHVACKAGWAAGQVIKEALMDDLDVPTLMLEVDGIDPRIASIEQIRGKFETFFETYF